MAHNSDITKNRSFKHLSNYERGEIYALLKEEEVFGILLKSLIDLQVLNSKISHPEK